MSALRIGTRGSALALTQAGWVASRLPVATELVTIRTSGDRGADDLDKSRWVDTIETALLAGDVDLAVHSAKDVPGELAPGTVIAAVPVREDPLDVLLGAVPAGARVGTASLRRRAQLLAWREDLDVRELRGNVDTRIRKWRAGEVDALVLAGAGLARLGRVELDEAVALGAPAATAGVTTSAGADPVADPDPHPDPDPQPDDLVPYRPWAGGMAPSHLFVPAAGQGALVVQAREDDERAVAAAAVIDDAAAHACLAAERAAVAVLGASCRTPVGVFADGASVRGFVGMPDGSEWVLDAVDGADGEALAERMLAAGAGDILERLG